MYTKDGESYFIVDSHVALWDAREANQRNIHGKQFIDCFYDYHRNLSPESEVWTYEEYLYQGGERLMKDLFTDGYVDHAIFQPAHLGEFYTHGFGQTDEASALAAAHPDQLTYNHFFDPRDGEQGLEQLHADAERFGLKGVKLYTAAWYGESRGWRARRPLGAAPLRGLPRAGDQEHPCPQVPTIRPLDRDAFDVADVDHVASEFTDLNFIVEDVGLPRLEDFAGSPPRSATFTAASRSRCRSSTPPALLRRDHRRAPLLDRRGPHPVLQRLRHRTPSGWSRARGLLHPL